MPKGNWWRRGTPEEDQAVTHAANELLEGISDADMVNKVQDQMDLNLRDQVTVEEAEDWHKDRVLRGFSRRN